MKLGIIFSAVVFGLFLGTGIALAGYRSAPTVAHQDFTVPAMEVAPPAVELTSPAVFEVGEVTIYGQAPHYTHRNTTAAKKHFVCGPMHDNAVGGRNSDCEWH